MIGGPERASSPRAAGVPCPPAGESTGYLQPPRRRTAARSDRSARARCRRSARVQRACQNRPARAWWTSIAPEDRMETMTAPWTSVRWIFVPRTR